MSSELPSGSNLAMTDKVKAALKVRFDHNKGFKIKLYVFWRNLLMSNWWKSDRTLTRFCFLIYFVMIFLVALKIKKTWQVDFWNIFTSRKMECLYAKTPSFEDLFKSKHFPIFLCLFICLKLFWNEREMMPIANYFSMYVLHVQWVFWKVSSNCHLRTYFNALYNFI